LNGTAEPGDAIGSRFKGSIWNGLNGAVEAGFAAGSRLKGSVRDGLNGAVGLGVAGCGRALSGPCRVAFGCGCPIKEKGIFAADERRWTQMSR
jgi:hypothetical protein